MLVQTLRNIVLRQDPHRLRRNLGAELFAGLFQPKEERVPVVEDDCPLQNRLEDLCAIGVRTINMGDNAPIFKVEGEDGKETWIEIPHLRLGIRCVEMVDREEETRQGTHLETLRLRILEIMELDTQLTRRMTRPNIRTLIRKAVGMMDMIGITDAFAFMSMLRPRAKSLAIR